MRRLISVHSDISLLHTEFKLHLKVVGGNFLLRKHKTRTIGYTLGLKLTEPNVQLKFYNF